MTLNPRLAFVAFAASTLLAACGGGGGSSGSGSNAATAGSATAGNPLYSQTLLVTVNGSNLDTGISANSAGCANLALSTTAPNISNASTAYFKCTVNAVGAQQVTVLRGDGATLITVPFTVPVPQVTLAVSNGAGVAGNVVITLTPQQTPVTVTNFLNYVNAGFYAGTVFHRLVSNFVIQGGGYASPLTAGGALPTHKTTNAAITLEDGAGLSNLKWTVAMARTNVADSATSEFFFNLVDNTFLDKTSTARGYAVFGSITAGTDVVTAMSGAPCAAWPAFFGGGTDCLPSPNLVVTGAVQTR
jgi:cyclophilin family peptidyl-prolyl cis-trans isomerase